MQQKTFDLNTLNGINGFTVPGIAGSQLGFLVGTAGDINGDGMSDLVLVAQSGSTTYVVFGNPGGFGAIFNLTNLNGVNGFTISGSGIAVRAVSTAGDINGDGISDLILGVPGANSNAGASYVIFGKGGFSSFFNPSSLNGGNGFNVPGITASGLLGSSVSTAGDVNGDGISDLILGAPYANSYAGASYVIFGRRTGFSASFNLTSLNGGNGFAIPGIAANGRLGTSVSTAGDVNGDGISDLILGAPGANSNAGACYIIFGSRGGFSSSFNLANLNGTNGFTVPGVALPSVTSGGDLGASVSTAGDINSDGISDLILGAPYANSYAGASYAIFGRRTGFSASFNLTTLNGTNGLTVPGLAVNDVLGSSLNTAGDINGDGISDLILGARGANSGAGACYMVFGRRNGFPAFFNLTILNGTNGFTAPGLAANDVLGGSVSTAGDVNGDGVSDIILGAFNANSSAGASYVIFGYSLVWINNQMTIIEGQSLLLTSMDLSVIDFSNAPANVTFVVTNLQGGRFELVSNFGVPITTFTQQQINNNQVRFISDRTAGVAYAVSATKGQFTLRSQPANVTFINNVPIVINPPSTQFIEINQFFQFNIQANQIFSDPDNDPLTYFVKLSNGSSLPNWINFNVSQNELDFRGTAPTAGSTRLSLSAQDPLNATASTQFDLIAKSLWVNNQMTITQGQSLVLNNSQLDATGLNDPVANIVFTVSNVQGGQFELLSTPNASITTFTQQQINNNQVRFVSNRTAPVTYQVSVTDGRFTLLPMPANVNFTNHAPEIINIPPTQLVEPNKPFQFSLQANQIFNDTDGDPLQYTATLSNGSSLPSWMSYSNQSNQLAFSGIVPAIGRTVVSLSAQDPLNYKTNTQFEIIAQFSEMGANSAQIAGSVVGGLIGLAVLIGSGFGFWRYTTDKNTRKDEHFADYIRNALNLKDVSNFKTDEAGKKYVAFVHSLDQALQKAGIDPSVMRPGELRELANDVATAARNKITPATNCLRQSVITVTDLNNNLETLVNEVQILRNAGRQSAYTV